MSSDSSSNAVSGHREIGEIELVTGEGDGVTRQVFHKDDGRRLTLYRSNAARPGHD
jgi:hypothetical protein